MARFLLLLFLCSWSLLTSEGCETGVAHVGNALSVLGSLTANADVALLKTYTAQTVDLCMHDCCTGTYGACTVASFKKNSTKNCLHFNCRPVQKCKFMHSNTTDSFSFSSDSNYFTQPVPSSHNHTSTHDHTVPSTYTVPSADNHTSTHDHTVPSTHSHTVPTIPKQDVLSFSLNITSASGSLETIKEENADSAMDQQFAVKNDNKTIKPRKGVSELTPDNFLGKSGIKPRKGVSMDDVPHSEYLVNGEGKSNVKARKGVEMDFDVLNSTFSDETDNSTEDSASNAIISALKNVLEDDVHPTTTGHSVAFSTTITSTEASENDSTTFHSNLESSIGTTDRTSSEVVRTTTSTLSPMQSLQSSTELHSILSFSSSSPLPSATARHSSSEQNALSMQNKKERLAAEDQRRYTSSMHLVLSLVFGLLVLFAVLSVAAKRMYDSWQRRDYYRMNYLIDGVYNGVD